MSARAAQTRRRTRIQEENETLILDAALEVFSDHGFRGASLDDIARGAGMSKPNMLYYFKGKEEIHLSLLNRLLDDWLAPLQTLDPEGEPLEEIRQYIRLKLQLARDFPRESRLFANEILRGAPHIGEYLSGPLKDLVDDQASVIQHWIDRGQIAVIDPRHLIFMIWATTQHYADFDTQISAVLGPRDATRFEDAASTVERLILGGLAVE
ncbi:MAG: TetR family transcriptional regulator C-terminal domain-containing protein [Pseudomonadota bacterium]